MEGGIMTAVQTSNPVHDAEGAVEAGIHEVGATIDAVEREVGRTGVRYSEYREPFERLLRETLAEMFDPAIPFRQCEDAEHTCRYCDFREICKR